MADFSGKEEPGPDPWLPEVPTQPRGPKTFADESADFALEFYEHLGQEPGNLFFSPFSIRMALGIAYAGARGETAAQMREALRFPPSEERIHVAATTIIERLNAAGGGKYEMTVANSLWGQDGAALQAEFLDVVARHYADGMNLVDFRSAAEAARVTINKWVEHKTRQKIRELIAPGGIGADTRLVLVNAVYFKGMWELQFRKAATSDEPFHLGGGKKVQAPLMHQQVWVRHMQTKNYQAVDLHYRGGDLSMLVLLPDRKDGLRDLETKLSARMLHDCVMQLTAREVKLFLPRFTMSWGAEIGAHLRALGMLLALTRFQADFSGINGHEPPHEDSLFISAVIHGAFIDVHEEGTEAAASTAVAMDRMGSALRPTPVPIFRADHPFLFAIRDRKSGALLFLGRMVDPTREG